LLRETGAGPVAPWQDVGAIERELGAAFRRWKNGETLQLRQDVSRYSRRGLAAQLAAVFDELLTGPAANRGSSA
jgi:hypothetical protein